MTIHRYLETVELTSQLDPMTDVISWIRGLRSVGYSSDILRSVHGFTDKNTISNSARAISAYVDTAVQLLDQGQSSSTELSYLPTYYAMLNLAKAVIIFSGHMKELSSSKYHGATWGSSGKNVQTLLTDEITLRTGGAIPLYYQSLVGKPWYSQQKQQRVIKLSEVYPYILNIQFEFSEIYKLPTPLHILRCNVENINGAYRLAIHVEDQNQPSGTVVDKRNYKILTGLKLENNVYVSHKVKANSLEEATGQLFGRIQNFLIYSQSRNSVYTPLSKSNLLLPEEIPILFAHFHLSNVVRYDPIALKRLFNSNAISVLEALARHATLRYLLLFWAYVNQKCYFINSL